MIDFAKLSTLSATSEKLPEHTMNSTDGLSFFDEPISNEFANITDNSRSVLSNWEAHLYGEIFQAISEMLRLPEDDPLSLEPKVAYKALNLLGFLKEQMKVAPPRIINQDGEALAFTWMQGNLKRYLTVADDEVDLMHLVQNQSIRCEEVLSNDEKLPYQAIFERLSAEPKSRSTDR